MENERFIPGEAKPRDKELRVPLEDEAAQLQAVAERVGMLRKFRESKWVKRLILIAGLLAGGEGALASSTTERGAAPDTAKVEQLQSQVKESIAEAKESVAVIDQYVRAHPDQKFQAEYLGKASAEFRKQIGNVEVTVNDFFTMAVMVDTSATGEIKTKYAFDKGSDGSLESVVMVPGELSKDDRAMAVLDIDADPNSLETKVGMADLMFEDERGTPFNNRGIFVVNPNASEGRRVFVGSY
ncbi:MAG: hypothetical protein WC786_05000, partial [Patescibacteria group bacterium]